MKKEPNVKALSAGVILTDGIHILGCRPFSRKEGIGNYDIPKGHWEDGEELWETALRETLEETGYEMKKDWLVEVGRFEYIPMKDLHIFISVADSLPDLSTLKCTSYFEYKGHMVPEVVGFKKIPVEELHWFFPSLAPIVEASLDFITNMDETAEDGD